MEIVEKIAPAGNTEIPAYLTIISMGYSVQHEKNNELCYSSKKSGVEFLASSMLELLGLIMIREVRGENWSASDAVIDDYLNRFV